MKTSYIVPPINEETVVNAEKLQAFLNECKANGVPTPLVSLLICAYSHKVAKTVND